MLYVCNISYFPWLSIANIEIACADDHNMEIPCYLYTLAFCNRIFRGSGSGFFLKVGSNRKWNKHEPNLFFESFIKGKTEANKVNHDGQTGIMVDINLQLHVHQINILCLTRCSVRSSISEVETGTHFYLLTYRRT